MGRIVEHGYRARYSVAAAVAVGFPMLAAPAQAQRIDCIPAPPPANIGPCPDPLPGPTLRAQAGDVIRLTFLNQINASNVGNPVDRGESAAGSGCDES